MAARKMAIRQDDQTRAKIQAGNIIFRLQKAFDGEIVLTKEQISIAKILLGKVLPDLQSTENKTEITHRSVMRMPGPAKTADEWKPTLPTTH